MDFNGIFNIKSPDEFEEQALRVFHFQYKNNTVYRDFCTHLRRTPLHVKRAYEIPFLPISFFKTHRVVSRRSSAQEVFSSSGTTGSTPSTHLVTDISYYRKSYRKAFQKFYGKISNYIVLALLPSYLERKGSSLVYMVNDLIEQSNHAESGFFLYDVKTLSEKLRMLDPKGTPILLLGVSFALLDMVAQQHFRLKNTIVMETGGMKGRRKEIIRKALHDRLCSGFGVEKIHSEYGMTELLSQAYAKGEGIFKCPPWMKVYIREVEDPLQLQGFGKTGGLNIIDLANANSCAFIATQDLGKVYKDGCFEVLGRYDHADIRGCNLMVW